MYRKIFAIAEGYVDISNLLKDCRDCVTEDDELELKKLLTKTLVQSEKSTIELRKLMAQNINTKAEAVKLDKAIVDSNRVSVEDDDKVLSIRMPIILPFKKVKEIRRITTSLRTSQDMDDDLLQINSTLEKLGLNELFVRVNSILGALDIAMQQYAVNSTYEERARLYTEATYVFTNYFKFEPNELSPDPDNLEYKQIIDVVSRYLSFGNDNHITIIVKNEPAEYSYTELKVYPNTYKVLPQKC